MDLRALRSFATLAEQQHFGRAAKALALSQPALSKQLRRLEEEIGAPLLDRGRHGASLTQLGRWFADEARRLIQQADQLLIRSQRAALGEIGLLKVGFGIATLELVPQIIARFRARYPGVDVELHDMPTADQFEALNQGRLDVGFVRLPAGAGLESLRVLDERIVLAQSSTRRRASGAIDLADLAAEPFVMLACAPHFHAHAMELCAEAGFRPRIVQEVNELTAVLAMVAAGSGVALVPASARRMRPRGVSYHALASRTATWTVGAAWLRRRKDRLLHAFLELVRREVGPAPSR